MEEGEASMGIGMTYDYIAIAAQAVVDRQRYFDAFIHDEVKNNLSEVKRK